MRATRIALLIALTGLSGCVTMPRIAAPPVAAAVAPPFDPMTFFNGRLTGEGRLKKLFSGTVATAVESHGRVEHGVLYLTQTVREGAKPAETRTWSIRQVGPGRYAGKLDKTPNPIAGEAAGNRLHLSFVTRSGYAADQWLTLAPDGRSAYNEMRVRKFGIQVAALSEVIRKAD
ncbi:DUF3833 family protein [Sphingomonas sabuli]|uniref:DUF3833 family protein n=1 Tax=Sphingomonas sabuli TaxID=2764186 RepID=A0A7G9KZM4_9SPHN|nr:DUF3833 family protein [Sphingomonas sabuli]QNM81823.1 DUF3833 family protein [Sphingomonas sabuli]